MLPAQTKRGDINARMLMSISGYKILTDIYDPPPHYAFHVLFQFRFTFQGHLSNGVIPNGSLGLTAQGCCDLSLTFNHSTW